MKFLDEEKGLGKPNHKSKDWLIEYKWKSLKHFNNSRKGWFSSKIPYTEDWQKMLFHNRFLSSKAALQSIQNMLKKAKYNQVFDEHLSKYYRVRNEKTNEIINYEAD